jgi:hypothetical protein
MYFLTGIVYEIGSISCFGKVYKNNVYTIHNNQKQFHGAHGSEKLLPERPQIDLVIDGGVAK